MSSPDNSLEDAFPLSPLQQGMLFHALFAPHSGVDIEQLVVTNPTPFDEVRIKAAFTWLTERHGALRTRLVWEGGGEPLQKVLSRVELPWESTALPLAEFLAADRQRGFCLSEAPLLRVTMVSERQLVWSFHHSILDGRCYPTLLRELFARYADPQLDLPAPSPYRRYIDWLSARNPAQDDVFWNRIMGDWSAPTPLTVERLGDVSSAGGEGRVELTVPGERTDALTAFAASRGVTLNTLVQGAWGLLLARYSNEEEVVFGTVRTCRHGSVEGAEQLIGPLINAVPVRVATRPDLRLADYLIALRAQHLAVRPHEHAALSRVQNQTQVPRGTKLFDSLVMFESYELSERTGLDVVLHESTGYALTLMAYGGERLRLCLSYDRSRFSEATAQRVLGHVDVLLSGFLTGATSTLSNLPLLTSAERDSLAHFATPEAEFPVAECLHERFSRQVKLSPNAVAVSFEGTSLTYTALNERSNRLAHRLRRLGVGPETLVGLRVERSPDILVGVLAILKAGGAYLPIDTAYPDERAQFILQDAGARVLLTRRALSELHGSFEALYFDDDLSGEPTDDPATSPTPDGLAYVIYTSGSTGKPKGVAITHRNVMRLFAATDAWFGFGPSDVWTLFHSHAFDFSVWEIWGALLYGGRVVVVPYHTSRDPEAFLTLLRAERVTVLNQTPSAFRQLIAADGEHPGGNSLRYVIFGGEALDLASLRPWTARHGDAAPKLVNMYGITETCVHVTYRPLSAAEIEEARGSLIGRPLPDLSLQVLQPSGEPAPIGVPGELFVGGAGLSRGYVGRTELTAERFPEGPHGRLYRTGDLARRLPDGEIEYLGRIDQQVQLRGFRIELGEIESALTSFDGVRETAVLLREDTPGEQRLVAYLVATPEPPLSAVREHLLKTLPAYMVPSAFVFLPTLPLTGNGKTDRKALPAPAPVTSRSGETTPPRNSAEAMLVRIWEEVLRQSDIGIHDNFFERGGDSILSIHVVSKARQAGLSFTTRQIFENPTVAALVATLGATASATTFAFDEGGPAPRTPIQRWLDEQELPAPYHYNQAFAFRLTRPVPAAELDAALGKVIALHDVLAVGVAPVEEVGELGDDAALALAERLQSSLSPTDGPLIRAARYSWHGEERLLVVCHHDAVDGVSWRVLLEDIEAALDGRSLAPATTSLSRWAHAVAAWVRTPEAESQRPFWESVVADARCALPTDLPGPERPLEATARTVTVALEARETEALLSAVPAAFGTRANDALLSALARALAPWVGSGEFVLDLEGHGREEIHSDLDLSRSMGWLTSIFPMRLALDTQADAESALKETASRLKAIPKNGFGYGPLRYLAERPISGAPTQLVFNFMGQLDSLCAGSALFSLSEGPTGPWHGPKNPRRHALEVLAAVQQGRLTVTFTYSEELHREETVAALAARYRAALRELVAAAERPAPYALTPMQALFVANPAMGYQVWRFSLSGPLDIPRFRAAWERVLSRHTILRTTFNETAQCVQPSVRLPFVVRDLRTSTDPESEVETLLEAERAMPFALDTAPLLRLTLLQTSDSAFTLLWSTHHLLIDGWSWPLLWKEIASLYADPDTPLAPAVPFKRYIEYREAHRGADMPYWKSQLSGLTRPTPLPAAKTTGSAGSDGEVCASVPLPKIVRSPLGATLSTLLQAAWALVLARHSHQQDVVSGAAFSGRPEGLPGALEMVGSLVNNLPVRVRFQPGESLFDFLSRLQREHVERVAHQDASLAEIQSQSEVPQRYRLFDSLLVVQNYGQADSLDLAGGVGVRLLEAPDHTAYPLTLVATPCDELHLKLAYRAPRFDDSTAQVLLSDLCLALDALTGADGTVGGVLARLSPPLPLPVETMRTRGPVAVGETEKTLAALWQKALGLESVGRDENFFELGAHSLLLVGLHRELCATLGRDVPLVALFAHPTIARLARYVDGGERDASLRDAARDRVSKLRAAQVRQRTVTRR
jgi:amino acid adenylation domain-containing protein/non-ribosomal peptide synthase protein (TIGR01720 family)